VIDGNDLHPQKQPSPKDFTYSVILIDINDGYSEKQ
jgi:hypothetical protein